MIGAFLGEVVKRLARFTEDVVFSRR
jgi:hypothetical protein